MSLFHLIMTSNSGQISISLDLVAGFRLISMKKIEFKLLNLISDYTQW